MVSNYIDVPIFVMLLFGAPATEWTDHLSQHIYMYPATPQHRLYLG